MLFCCRLFVCFSLFMPGLHDSQFWAVISELGIYLYLTRCFVINRVGSVWTGPPTSTGKPRLPPLRDCIKVSQQPHPGVSKEAR